MKITAASLLLLTAIILAPALNARTWTDKQGRTLEADLVRIISDHSVEVRRHADGRQFKIALRDLSDADQEYVRRTIKIQAADLSKYRQSSLREVGWMVERVVHEEVYFDARYIGLSETQYETYRNRTVITITVADGYEYLSGIVALARDFEEMLLRLPARTRIRIAGETQRDGIFLVDHIFRVDDLPSDDATPSTP